jgi:hypothetical protein
VYKGKFGMYYTFLTNGRSSGLMNKDDIDEFIRDGEWKVGKEES